jgi:hypothetical protein
MLVSNKILCNSLKPSGILTVCTSCCDIKKLCIFLTQCVSRMQLRSPLLWYVTWRRLLSGQPISTTFKGQAVQAWNWQVALKHQSTITSICCMTFQKGRDLRYTAVKAWNLAAWHGFPYSTHWLVLEGFEAQLRMLFFFSLSMSCVPPVLSDMMWSSKQYCVLCALDLRQVFVGVHWIYLSQERGHKVSSCGHGFYKRQGISWLNSLLLTSKEKMQRISCLPESLWTISCSLCQLWNCWTHC